MIISYNWTRDRQPLNHGRFFLGNKLIIFLRFQSRRLLDLCGEH
jgi:hypothetical protein